MAGIDALDGIEPSDARSLRRAGIRTMEALLRKGVTADGRSELASRVTLGEQEILDLVLRIDLMRVKGLGGLYCRLLNHAGVFTIKDLRERDPHTLHAMLVQVNDRFGLARRLPNLGRVTSWVTEANAMESVVER